MRSVNELVKSMGMTGINKNQVSRLCAEIKRRTSIVGIFPDEPAITKLVGALVAGTE